MTVMTLTDPRLLPIGAQPVDPDGLLARVRRPCAEHGDEAVCVGRDSSPGRLVFWCGRGEHHLRSH
jgi:hypothetical protein